MKRVLLTVASFAAAITMFGQQFELPKLNSADFDKVKVTLGGDFALQYQAIDNVGSPIIKLGGVNHEPGFMPLGSGVNLPAANMVISSDLAPGMKVVLTTYLSSRHHNESWVKDGYLLIDAMPFMHSSFVDGLMQNLTLKTGVMEVNYGDAHFRRSDNGHVTANKFVENYIMEAFMTAPALELMYRNNGWIAMGALTGGTLNPALVGFNNTTKNFDTYDMVSELAFYGKFGYETKLDNDLKLRFTVSPYYNSNNHRGTLYGSDRAGARYFSILVPDSIASGAVMAINSAGTDIKANAANGHWGPGATYKVTSVMLNAYAEFKGLEFFGTYETTKGTNVKDGPEFKYNQLAAELLYHFGCEKQFYVGTRYNTVSNQNSESVNRIQVAGGWYLTPNVMMKAEYVNQKYDISSYTKNSGFKGMMVEAAISF